jgi:PAS domain S-box-containing protein
MNSTISSTYISDTPDFKFLEARPGITTVLLANSPIYSIVAVSNDFIATSGRKREEVIGKSHFEIFPENPADPSSSGVHSLKNSFNYILQQRSSHSLPLVRYDIPDSKGGFLEKYWKSTNAPVFNEKGEVTYVIHTAEDVTDQVLAERTAEKHQELQRAYQQLEESEKKYRSLFESIDQAFCVVEMIYNENGEPIDHLILETNPVFEVQTGLKNVIGKTAREAEPGIEPHWFTLYDNVLRTGKPLRFIEESKALNRWFDVFVYPVGNPQTKKVAVLFTDITERKKLELALKESESQLQGKVEERTSELEEKNKELKRSNTNLEEFAYAASHDMKEPIRKIHFFAERLKARLLHKMEEEDLRYFERLEAGAKRMNTLIDDLLLYSHVNRGMASIETVNLNQMLSFVLDDLELHIEEKGATIEIGKLPTIQGRPRQLQQMFENLIANALKYSKEEVKPVVSVSSQQISGGEIKVHSSVVNHDKWYHLIKVKDNGIGFEQADAERIFTVFTRLHGNTEYRGTGVGLSIVQKIVENHKGHIWAESQPGEGATFNILLPVE